MVYFDRPSLTVGVKLDLLADWLINPSLYVLV